MTDVYPTEINLSMLQKGRINVIHKAKHRTTLTGVLRLTTFLNKGPLLYALPF